jgi:hypothetical protein
MELTLSIISIILLILLTHITSKKDNPDTGRSAPVHPIRSTPVKWKYRNLNGKTRCRNQIKRQVKRIGRKAFRL